jgi:hypothetical protein
MSMKSEIEKVERGFWEHGQDATYYKENTDENFVGVFAEMGYVDQASAVKMTKKSDGWSDLKMTDTRWIELGSDSAAIVYKATAKMGDKKEPYSATITSVYVKKNGGWKLALHEHLPEQTTH